MRHFSIVPAVFALSLMAAPAFAQLSAMGAGDSGPNAPQPKAAAPDVAPPALPGANTTETMATGPNLQKPVTGDPTTALFTAVNSGDYNAAQDAISRGADTNAQNSLGETPLDLSIALNRNDITFMLLSARNEGGNDGTTTPAAMPVTPKPTGHHKAHIVPARVVTAPLPASPGNSPGTPDPAAGFLGFKSQ
jgi:hypothetical protein